MQNIQGTISKKTAPRDAGQKKETQHAELVTDVHYRGKRKHVTIINKHQLTILRVAFARSFLLSHVSERSFLEVCTNPPEFPLLHKEPLNYCLVCDKNKYNYISLRHCIVAWYEKM